MLKFWFLSLLGFAHLVCWERLNAAEPFYPLGLYGVNSTNDFALLRKAGFNLVVGRAEQSYLDAAHAAGLRVFAPPLTAAGPRFDAKAAAQAIMDFDRHPALWAWYLVDEPDFQELPPEQVAQAQRTFKALGAKKPTALTLFQGYEALDYGNISDILMVDRYPVPWLPLANLGQHVGTARLALGRSKPLFAVIQASDWNSCPQMLPGEKNLRAPTFEEIRCMTYDALARGANGLFYFAYDSGAWKIREHPEIWSALQKVVKEVNARLPLFAGQPQWWAKSHEFGDRAHRFNAALESSVSSTLLRVSDGNTNVAQGDYVLAVNNTETSLKYGFALPPARVAPAGNESKPGTQAPPQPVPVLGESRTIETKGNRVTDHFDRYAVHIYGPL